MSGIANREKIHIRDINLRLIVYVIALSVTGIFLVNSATAKEVTQTVVSTTVKQVIGVFAGIAAAAVLALIDYRKLSKFSVLLYLFAIALLLYVYFFAAAIYGAKRWIYFPLFGTIQPSEFAKPALLLFLAFIIDKLGPKLNKVYGVLTVAAVALPVLFLILIEPDLSTSIMIFLLIITALYLGNISYKWIIGAILILIPFVVVFFIGVYQKDQVILNKILEEHQIYRINAFFFPEDFPKQAYQQEISVMAIGSGGLFGKGLNNSSLESVKNGSFLSEEQCDFIFAVIGEELGFIGSVAIIALICLITYECLRTASRCRDTLGKIIAGGAGAVFFLQSFINIGVSVLLLPNTGIPLPFVSAGLSSLLSSYILIGLVLSVSLHTKSVRKVYYV